MRADNNTNVSRKITFKLYLITDRNLTRGGLLAVLEEALRAAADSAPAGSVAVQLREKDLTAKALFELASQVKEICDRFHTPLLINDRIDVAMAVDADGVHLAGNSIGASDVRKLLKPPKLVGVSTHNQKELAAAEKEGADFAVFGPVYETISKPGYGAPLGKEQLARAAKGASIPVFALGGITADRARDLSDCGAAGVAVIGAIISSSDPGAATKALLDAVMAWR